MAKMPELVPSRSREKEEEAKRRSLFGLERSRARENVDALKKKKARKKEWKNTEEMV